MKEYNLKWTQYNQTKYFLCQVRNFLPQMAEAEVELNTALRNGQGDQLNIENVDDDEKVIEMDVALMKVILILWYFFTREFEF